MIPIGLFSQVATALLSVAIIITYIKPTFSEISQIQDSISVYQQEHAKVSKVNDTLASLVTKIENIPSGDQKRLLTYMPDTVDSVAVVRDINFILENEGVLITEIVYEGEATNQGQMVTLPDGTMQQISNGPKEHEFTFEFEGSYEQMKAVLKSLEENDYPLEITKLTATPTDGGFLTVAVKVSTYNRQVPGLPAPDPALAQ
jgi:hypothetical protein